MTDSPDEATDPNETSFQKALRLKKAAIAARPAPPRGGKFQREQAARAHANAKSKPWLTR